MEIRDIQIFRTVMHAGTTSKAAVLLGISQPAVSQSVRKLEASSGLRLFERVRGRLVPTQEAMALMGDVDRFFDGFALIEHRVRSLKSFGLGRISVACYPALGGGFMPRAIAAFGPADKQVQMSLQIMSSREVYQHVLGGQLDFGLMADEISLAGLEHSRFATLPGIIVMPPAHPLARKKMLTIADIAAHAFIALNPEDRSRPGLQQALKEANKSLRTVVETPYSSTVCELALQGVGIGISNPIVALDYAARGLVLKRAALGINFAAVLVFRPGTPMSENAKELLRIMRIQLEADLGRLEKLLMT